MTNLPSLFSDNLLDVFFKDFFNDTSPFQQIASCTRNDISYPVNVIKNKDNIQFDVACTGLDKDDVKLSIEDDVLNISYNKKDKKETSEKDYIYRGITQKSFNLGWKISNEYELSKIKANMDKGLLKITIPLSEKKKPKLLDVEIE